MKNILLIAAICAATAVNVQAVQGSGQGPGQGMVGEESARLALLDSDGDGIITREEMETARQTEFEAADTDGDGYLGAAELAAMQEAQRADRLSTLFDLIDADDDLVISLEEMVSASPSGDEAVIGVQFDAFAGDDGVMDEGEFAYMHSPEAQATRRFIAMDSDGDGYISSDEYGAPVAGSRGGNGGPGQRPQQGGGPQFPGPRR